MDLKNYFGMLLIVVSVDSSQLFPQNKQVTYNWKAKIKVGSALPEPLYSSWEIKADIRVQNDGNITTFKLSNIATNQSSETVLNSLLLPFQAVYEDGKLLKMTVEYKDVLWSVNIKRSLATLFQLKLDSLDGNAFYTQEAGLFGNCKVEYVVLNYNNTKSKTVRKNLDIQTCWSHTATRWSNSPAFTCPVSYQNEISAHSERVYEVDFDTSAIIQIINAKGVVVLQPYQAKAEAHDSVVSQTVKLEKIETITEEIKLQGQTKSCDLLYEELQLDPTYGHVPSNKTSVLLEIANMLAELSDSLWWWEVGPQGLNNETMFHLVDLMWSLELKDWEILYSSITLGTSYKQETVQHLFWELVPEIGSEESALFVRDLVKSGRVKGLLASRLLVNFPLKIRYPTEEILVQCEELLRLGPEVTDDVRNSAVLSFASLIQKTCSRQCKGDTLDRYAKLYLDRFTDSTEHDERMLYLQGFSNMNLGQALDYLKPVITGQTKMDRHIRFLAIWASSNTAYMDPDKVFEVFWPLLNNRSECLELRVASLSLLILTKPTPSRFISLFWYMKTEPSQQLYNFYYTTIKSLSETTYPCYSHLGRIASQITRFVLPRSSVWATGNYILDYEDGERGYGGLLQLLLIASERTGLPNVFIFTTEQHALGIRSQYEFYLKVEGVDAGIKRQLQNITSSGSMSFPRLLQLLQGIRAPIKEAQQIHMEVIFKVDGKTIKTLYLNDTTFNNVSSMIKQLSLTYFEFSVNYQRIWVPLAMFNTQPTDIGTPALMQIRSSSLISARGSVKQDNEGSSRNTELDLRYSWNGITSLQLFNPFTNAWFGAVRSRSLHIRLPFAMQLVLNFAKSFFKVVAVRHRDFIAGSSRLGLVWHATITLIGEGKSALRKDHSLNEDWRMDSEDLGARLGASVFNCPGPSTISDALHLLKRAFLIKNKNYQMIPGGVALLGIFSLKDQLSFQPPGGNCGLMLSFTPLLNHVEPVLLLDGNQLRISMTRSDGMLWEIKAGLKQQLDGNKQATFKLYHAPSVSGTKEDIWRVLQFEGAFVIASSKAGVFHPPAPLTGYMFVSWGDSSPTHADRAAVIDVKVVTSDHNGQNSTHECTKYTPTCLQSFSELATRQTAIVQYVNLPSWLIMAAHALFPEHVQTESKSTQVGFSVPAPFTPWNTKGLCAINGDSILTLDNTTVAKSLGSCFTVAVADCSAFARFIVLVKKAADPKYLAVKIYSRNDIIELLPTTNGNLDVFINENTKVTNITSDYDFGKSNTTHLHFSISMIQGGGVEVELCNGVILQHYTRTVVAMVPSSFRGFTCGLCADFNSDTYNEPVKTYTQC